ncbi:MAG: serine protease [Phycisphaerales bacterium]|nr:serine protease [Phycisphaerales bacterium]
MYVQNILASCCLLLVAGSALGQRLPEPPLLDPNINEKDETFVAAYRAMGHPRFLIQTIVAGPPGDAQVNQYRLDQAADLDSRLKGSLLSQGHVDLIPTGPAMYTLHGTPPILPGEVRVDQAQWTAWWGRFREHGQSTLISISPQDRSELKVLESLPLDSPIIAAKAIGVAEEAEIVVLIRLLDTPQRRGAPVQATYTMVDLLRNRVIGSHAWEVRANSRNAPWTTVHANALAHRIMRDFSAIDTNSGRGCRLVLELPSNQVQPAKLRDALSQVPGVAPHSINLGVTPISEDVSKVSMAFDFTGDVTQLHQDLDAQLAILGFGTSEIRAAHNGRLELTLKPPSSPEPIELVIDGSLSVEQLQDLKDQLRQISGTDANSIDLAQESQNQDQSQYIMNFVFRGSLLTLRNEIVEILNRLTEDSVTVISATNSRLHVRFLKAPLLEPFSLTIHGALAEGGLARLVNKISQLNGIEKASVKLTDEVVTSGMPPSRTITFQYFGTLIDLRESINQLVQDETNEPIVVYSVNPEGMVLGISSAPALERLVVLLQGPLGSKPLGTLRDDVTHIQGVQPASVRMLEERMTEGQPVLVIELAYESDLIQVRDKMLAAVSRFTDQPTIVVSSDRELLTLLVDQIPDGDYLRVQILGQSIAGAAQALTQAIALCPGVEPDSVQVFREDTFDAGDRLELTLSCTGSLATVRDAILRALENETGDEINVLAAAPGRLVFSIREADSSNGLIVNNNNTTIPDFATPQSNFLAVPDYGRMQNAVGMVVVRPADSPSVIATDDILSLGTAFMVLDNGQMITSRHVVTNDGSTDYRYDVLFDGGISAQATVTHISEDLDYAILDVGLDGIEPLSTSTQVNPGEPIFVYGFPSAAGYWAAAVDLTDSTAPSSEMSRHHRVLNVTSGNISAIHDTHGPFGRLIQCNATVYPGNSGGPMVNQAGEVIGVMSVRAFDPDDPSNQLESINGAISMDAILSDLGQIPTATTEP